MNKFILYLLLTLYSSVVFSKAGDFFFGASYIYSQVHYKEPNVMDEKGHLSGIGIDLRYDFSDLLYTNLQAKFQAGNLEYDGATFDGEPIKQTTDDLTTDLRALVYLNLGKLAPYSGYGYRFWRNDLVISYIRETTYHYMPLGFRYLWHNLYFAYEKRIFLKGVNKSYMSDVDPNRNDVTLKQNSGSGYALEAGHIGKFFNLGYKISLMYDHWSIADSKTASDGVDTLIEPHNSTNTISLSAGLFY